MTGSTLAAILIPPAGTIFLLAWLALVFYAGRDQPPAGRRLGRQVDISAVPLIEDEIEHAQHRPEIAGLAGGSPAIRRWAG